MTVIEKGTQARGAHNEDFCYAAELKEAGVHVMVVGDFAASNYKGLEDMASDELKNILDVQSLASVPVDVLLTSLAVQFNNRLLNRKKFKDASFQCCAIFAAIKAGVLHYLPIGDCRVCVRRGDNLMLLNGSIWADAAGSPLPPLITPQQETKRGFEEPPPFVLGTGEVSLLPMQVSNFKLETDDAVLLYSDGVDKILSPTQLLEIVSDGLGTVPLKEVVKRVLDEVRTRQGDDDRTFLIAAGPHEQANEEKLNSLVGPIQTVQQTITAEQTRQAEQLNIVARRQEDFLKLATDINQRLAKLDKLGSFDEQLKRLPEVLTISERIENAVKALPKASSGQDLTLPAGRDKKSLFEHIEEQLNTILRHVIPSDANGTAHVPQISRPKDDDRAKELQPGAQRTGAPAVPDANQPPPENTEALAKKRSDDGLAPQLSPVEEDHTNCYFREGVIRITRGRYQLIDEAGATELRGKGVGAFMYPARGVRPGALTAFYLYLRTLKQPKDSMSMEGVKNWIKSHEISDSFDEKVKQLSDSELIAARDWHWHVRDFKQNSDGAKLYEQVVVFETTHARRLFKVGGDASDERAFEGARLNEQEGAGAAQGGMGLDEAGDFSKYLTRRNMLIAVTSFLLVVAAIYYLSQDPTPPTRRVANTNTGVRDTATTNGLGLGLTVGADGRTLYVTREGGEPRSLGLLIQPGKENEFVRVLSEVTGDNEAGLRTALFEKAEERKVSLIPTVITTQGTELFKVEQSDLSGSDRCQHFVERVNLLLPRNVKTDKILLAELNPRLDCKNLKVGEQLLVNNTAR